MTYSIIKSYIHIQTYEQYPAIENKLKFSSIRLKLIFYLSRRHVQTRSQVAFHLATWSGLGGILFRLKAKSLNPNSD